MAALPRCSSLCGLAGTQTARMPHRRWRATCHPSLPPRPFPACCTLCPAPSPCVVKGTNQTLQTRSSARGCPHLLSYSFILFSPQIVCEKLVLCADNPAGLRTAVLRPLSLYGPGLSRPPTPFLPSSSGGHLDEDGCSTDSCRAAIMATGLKNSVESNPLRNETEPRRLGHNTDNSNRSDDTPNPTPLHRSGFPFALLCFPAPRAPPGDPFQCPAFIDNARAGRMVCRIGSGKAAFHMGYVENGRKPRLARCTEFASSCVHFLRCTAALSLAPEFGLALAPLVGCSEQLVRTRTPDVDLRSHSARHSVLRSRMPGLLLLPVGLRSRCLFAMLHGLSVFVPFFRFFMECRSACGWLGGERISRSGPRHLDGRDAHLAGAQRGTLRSGANLPFIAKPSHGRFGIQHEQLKQEETALKTPRRGGCGGMRSAHTGCLFLRCAHALYPEETAVGQLFNISDSPPANYFDFYGLAGWLLPSRVSSPAGERTPWSQKREGNSS